MTDPELALIDALRERLSIVADEESRRDADRHVARLQAISETINLLQSRLPEPVDPQLQHYLKRCSYSKALEWLEEKSDAARRGV
jgi:hypothetical protein